MNESNEGSPKLRLPPRPVSSTESRFGAINFWDSITPEKQAILELPLNRLEQWLARFFPDGYSSPLIDRAVEMSKKGQLEKQRDATSCTLVATANALRILDGSNPQYTVEALREAVKKVCAVDKVTMIDPRLLEELSALGSPFNKFAIEEPQSNQLHLVNTNQRLLNLF